MLSICRRPFIIFLISFVCAGTVLASPNHDFYNHASLGELQGQDYEGPLYHQFRFYRKTGEIKFFNAEESHLENKLSHDLFILEKFVAKDLHSDFLCPTSVLGENIEYTRYLFRLLSLSYIYELFRHHERVIKELGLDDNICDVQWKDLVGNCHPTSHDMKKFLQRFRSIDRQISYKVKKGHAYKKFSRQWLKTIRDKWQDETVVLKATQARIQIECLKNKDLCSNIDLSSVKSVMTKICRQDLILFNKICSEKDDIYGISQVPLAYQLLTKSNTMATLNQKGHAKSCLKKYVKLMSRNEKQYYQLSNIFDSVFTHLFENYPYRYIQGRPFLAGAMKEFDIKGLRSNIFDMPTPIPIPTVLAVKTKPAKVNKINKKKHRKVVVVKPRVVPTAVPTLTPRISAFERAFAMFNDLAGKKRSVDLNMNDFSQDFIFTGKMVKALKSSLTAYQTRAALKEMKKYDKLGSKDEPMKLLFIKYLIDLGEHQGLHNIVAEIGGTFFVANDIDQKNIPVYIELFNSEESNWTWQIRLIGEPPPENKQ